MYKVVDVGVCSLMEEHHLGLPIHMEVMFDRDSICVTKLTKPLNSMQMVINNVTCSDAYCGGYHKALKQANVKHNMYILLLIIKWQ